MAATLKLGNANWAAKEGSLLAYNDENDNFKPLPFDFTRASSATYVASDGLIKTSTTGQPRIDFSDNTNGTLLLEPQRTNVITYSEDFENYFNVTEITLNSNYAISPDGTLNANKVTFPTSSNSMYKSGLSLSGMHTISFYVKGEGANIGKTFDVDITGTSVSQNIDVTLTNDWVRFEAQTDGLTLLQITNRSSTTIGTGSLILFGFQIEEGSYPTSYIPTSGSTVTRVAEACSQTPASGVIGQTEGTVFFDVNISHIVGNEALGGINSGGYANHATIQRIGNTIQFVRNSATQSGATIVTSSAITVGRYKLALAYKSGDTACFLNGTQVSTTQTQTFTNATLNLIRISGDAIGALPISDTYNQAQLYNTRLSNSELATLTTI